MYSLRCYHLHFGFVFVSTYLASSAALGRPTWKALGRKARPRPSVDRGWGCRPWVCLPFPSCWAVRGLDRELQAPVGWPGGGGDPPSPRGLAGGAGRPGLVLTLCIAPSGRVSGSRWKEGRPGG